MSGRWGWFWLDQALDAFGAGITKAAEILCPVDHTAVRRAQAAADALADAEAEVDHLEPGELSDYEAGYQAGVDNERAGIHPDEPRAEGTQHADAPGEVSSGPAAQPSPGEPTPDSELLNTAAQWIQRAADDYSQRLEVGLPAARRLVIELRDRAAQFEAAESEPDAPVSHEDLSAHIYAIANMCIIRRNDRAPRMADVCDEIATDLLSDYRITKK